MQSPGSSPWLVRAAISTTVILGLVSASFWVVSTRHLGFGEPVTFITLTVLFTLTWLYPLLALWKEETIAFSLDEALFVATAILLPPLGMLTCLAVGATTAQLIRRRPLARMAFNNGQLLLAASLGLALVRVLSPVEGQVQPLDLAAVFLGSAVFFAVNSISVWTIISLAEKESFWRVASKQISFWILVWSGSTAVGLLAAIGGLAFKWVALLALVPVVVLHISLSNTLKAKQYRERVDGLFQAALEAHASVRVDGVEESVTNSAKELLKSRSSRISDEPPGEGELGVSLDVNEEAQRWLVVSEKRGVQPFDDADQSLLNALVAVGSSAFDNVRLIEEIKHGAFHDTLTGLPNQLLFMERVNQAIAQANRTGERVAVLFLDLDRLKKVNETMGHAAGNELLKEVGNRLLRQIRAGDTVARMSGDEFTLLLTGMRTNGAPSAAQNVLYAFQKPFHIGKYQLFITPSIGISVYPDDGAKAEILLKNADSAKHIAKQRGGNTFQTYTPAINNSEYDPLELEAQLHNAVEEEKLDVFYQPKVELRSGKLVGVEALVRWNDPSIGFISPDVFIPLAEETGLVETLDKWVLRTACKQAKRWSDSGLGDVSMAVNLSGLHFRHDRLIGAVIKTLRDTGVHPAQLELEVTERIAVDETDEALNVLHALRKIGVNVAIDDFGTGYSMLSRLLKFPITTLKIDRSFIQEIKNDTDEAPIMTALISMAHGMGMGVVAEGVETEEQRTTLDRLQCDHAQGYLFSKPVNASELTALLMAQMGVAEPAEPNLLSIRS